MEEPNRFAAARALKGCAIGDCLGIYYENGKHPPPGDDWKGDRYDYGTAIWTDDTQQSAVLLIDYLNDKDQRIDPARVMNAFVAMSEDGPGWFGTHRGTGQGFRHAVTQWRALGHAAPMPGRQGNGAAMRVAAVAYAMPRTTGSREQIRAVSSATHEAGIAIDAALAARQLARRAHRLRCSKGRVVGALRVTNVTAYCVGSDCGPVRGGRGAQQGACHQCWNQEDHARRLGAMDCRIAA
jgi:ADP-ribosylglycohydrolase